MSRSSIDSPEIDPCRDSRADRGSQRTAPVSARQPEQSIGREIAPEEVQTVRASAPFGGASRNESAKRAFEKSTNCLKTTPSNVAAPLKRADAKLSGFVNRQSVKLASCANSASRKSILHSMLALPNCARPPKR